MKAGRVKYILMKQPTLYLNPPPKKIKTKIKTHTCNSNCSSLLRNSLIWFWAVLNPDFSCRDTKTKGLWNSWHDDFWQTFNVLWYPSAILCLHKNGNHDPKYWARVTFAEIWSVSAYLLVIDSIIKQSISSLHWFFLEFAWFIQK